MTFLSYFNHKYTQRHLMNIIFKHHKGKELQSTFESDIQQSHHFRGEKKCFLSREITNIKTRPKRCQERCCNLILGWAFKSSQASSLWKTALSGPAWWAPSLCHCHLASALACQLECHPRTGC